MKFESLDEAYAVLLKLIDDFTSGKISFDEFEWDYQDAHSAYLDLPGAQIAEGFSIMSLNGWIGLPGLKLLKKTARSVTSTRTN